MKSLELITPAEVDDVDVELVAVLEAEDAEETVMDALAIFVGSRPQKGPRREAVQQVERTMRSIQAQYYPEVSD